MMGTKAMSKTLKALQQSVKAGIETGKQLPVSE
jgi:hypothetical protein